MLTLRRAAILLLLLSTLSARRSQAAWQGGAGFYVGFNSQVVDPSRLTDPTQGFGRRAVTAAFTPFVVWNGEYGRITAYVRLQGEVTGFLLLPFGLLGAYRGTLVTRLDVQLSETRTWSLALSGRGGSFNGGLSSSDPDGVPLEGLNIPATNFLSVDGRSLFSFKETPRVEISQQTVFRTFIPYGLFTQTPGSPSTGPSYTVDAQGIASYYWQRFSLGGDLLVGWFLPPPRTDGSPSSVGDRSLITLRFGARANVDVAPRLSAQVRAGLSLTTQTADFFSPSSTVVNPVGQVSLQKLFTRPEIETAFIYSHSAAADLAIGRFSDSDSLSLRAIAPLHPDVGLTTEATYRYSRAALSTGPSYHLLQFDATARWNFNEYLQLFGRYQFVYQARVGQVVPNQSSLLDFTRHVVLVGLSFMYPRR